MLKDVPVILSSLSSKVIKPIILGFINTNDFSPERIFNNYFKDVDLKSLLDIKDLFPESKSSKNLTQELLDSFLYE